jgi:hypothetical protein
MHTTCTYTHRHRFLFEKGASTQILYKSESSFTKGIKLLKYLLISHISQMYQYFNLFLYEKWCWYDVLLYTATLNLL